MKKDKLLIILLISLGIILGMIIQNLFNIAYSKNLENSLDLNIKLSLGERFIQIDNQSNIPKDNFIIDYDGTINRKLNINETK